MCRVFMATKHAIMVYNRKNNLTSLFGYLVQNCGGHGNGIALIKDKTIIYTKKGVDYSYKQAARALLLKNYDFALFHTRIASVSSISDTNCHPFTYQKRFALIMNGTINGLSGISESIGITDTECVFNVIKGLDMDTTIKALSTLSPVFLGVCDGLPYALKNSGALSSWTNKKLNKDDFIFSSVFPKDVKGVISLPYGYTWKDGKEVTMSKQKTYYNNSFYDDTPYYLDQNFESIGTTSKSKQTKPFEETTEDILYTEGWEDGYYTGYNDALSENLIS